MTDIGAIFVAIFVGAIGTFMVTLLITTDYYRSNAIERGYALYCPADGDFAWKGECDG